MAGTKENNNKCTCSAPLPTGIPRCVNNTLKKIFVNQELEAFDEQMNYLGKAKLFNENNGDKFYQITKQ